MNEQQGGVLAGWQDPLIGKKTKAGHLIVYKITDALGLVNTLKDRSLVYHSRHEKLYSKHWVMNWQLGYMLYQIDQGFLYAVIKKQGDSKW
jgi:hypothetical protein